MNYIVVVNSVEEMVRAFFSSGICKSYCYHNEIHTEMVVSAVKEMAEYYKLQESEVFILVAAAWFHDLGYADGGADNHEERSARVARNFLENQNVSEDLILQVEKCILATKMPQKPQNLLEQIICDADFYHLGSPNFIERNKLMFEEFEKVGEKQLDKEKWRLSTITLFANHTYHTSYAQEKLNSGKMTNLELLLHKKKEKSSSKKKNNSNKPERGIETMFRVTSTNSQRLSDMADNKANLLLTVNSIILSLIVTVLLKTLDKNTHLIIPTIILMTVIVVVMVLAILATIPKIPRGYFTQEEVDSKSVNLLFFGNFYKMPLETYKESMFKVMDDNDFLYGMLTKDVYSQGVVLGRKYRLLRYAYGTFMFGLIISVIAFVISILYV